jgi:hypothetical protein
MSTFQTFTCVLTKAIWDYYLENATERFINYIYYQWKLRTDRQIKIKLWLQNGKKASYYSCVVPSINSVMWSQRYFIHYNDKPTDSDSHEVQLFDCYNDKSV